MSLILGTCNFANLAPFHTVGLVSALTDFYSTSLTLTTLKTLFRFRGGKDTVRLSRLCLVVGIYYGFFHMYCKPNKQFYYLLSLDYLRLVFFKFTTDSAIHHIIFETLWGL